MRRSMSQLSTSLLNFHLLFWDLQYVIFHLVLMQKTSLWLHKDPMPEPSYLFLNAQNQIQIVGRTLIHPSIKLFKERNDTYKHDTLSKFCKGFMTEFKDPEIRSDRFNSQTLCITSPPPQNVSIL